MYSILSRSIHFLALRRIYFLNTGGTAYNLDIRDIISIGRLCTTEIFRFRKYPRDKSENNSRDVSVPAERGPP